MKTNPLLLGFVITKKKLNYNHFQPYYYDIETLSIFLPRLNSSRIKFVKYTELFADFCCLLQLYLILQIKRKYDFSRTVVVRVFCASLTSHTHTIAKNLLWNVPSTYVHKLVHAKNNLPSFHLYMGMTYPYILQEL